MTESSWFGKENEANTDDNDKLEGPSWRRFSRGMVKELKQKIHARRRAMSCDDLLFMDSDDENTVGSSLEDDYRKQKMLEAEITMKVLEEFDTVSESSSMTNSLCFQEPGFLDGVEKKGFGDNKGNNIAPLGTTEDGRSEAESVSYTNSFTESFEEEIECNASDSAINDTIDSVDNKSTSIHDQVIGPTLPSRIHDGEETKQDNDFEPMRSKPAFCEDSNAGGENFTMGFSDDKETEQGDFEAAYFMPGSGEDKMSDIKNIGDTAGLLSWLCEYDENLMQSGKLVRIGPNVFNEENKPICRFVEHVRDEESENNMKTEQMDKDGKGSIDDNVASGNNLRSSPVTFRVDEFQCSMDRGDYDDNQIISLLNIPEDFEKVFNDLNSTDKEETPAVEAEYPGNEYYTASELNENIIAKLDNDSKGATDKNHPPALAEYFEILSEVFTNEEDVIQKMREFDFSSYQRNAFLENISCNKGSTSNDSVTGEKHNYATSRRKKLFKDTVNVPLQRCIEKARLVSSIKEAIDKARSMKERVTGKAAYDKAVYEFKETVDNLLKERHKQEQEKDVSPIEKKYSADDMRLDKKSNSDPAHIFGTPFPRRRNCLKAETSHTEKIKHGKSHGENDSEKTQEVSKISRETTFVLESISSDKEKHKESTDAETDLTWTECTVNTNRVLDKTKAFVSAKTRCRIDVHEPETKKKVKRYRQKRADNRPGYGGNENNDDLDLLPLIEANKTYIRNIDADLVMGEKDEKTTNVIELVEKADNSCEIEMSVKGKNERTFNINVMKEETIDKTFMVDKTRLVEKEGELTFNVVKKKQQNLFTEDHDNSEDETLNFVASICNCEDYLIFDNDLVEEGKDHDDPMSEDISHNEDIDDCSNRFPWAAEEHSFIDIADIVESLEVIDQADKLSNDDVREEYKDITPVIWESFHDLELKSNDPETLTIEKRKEMLSTLPPRSTTNQLKRGAFSDDLRKKVETDQCLIEPKRCNQKETAKENLISSSYTEPEDSTVKINPITTDFFPKNTHGEHDEKTTVNDFQERHQDGKFQINIDNNIKTEMNDPVTSCVTDQQLNPTSGWLSEQRNPNDGTNSGNFVNDSVSSISSTSGEYSLRIQGGSQQIDGDQHYDHISKSLQHDIGDACQMEESDYLINLKNRNAEEPQLTFPLTELLIREKSPDNLIEAIHSDNKAIYHHLNESSAVVFNLADDSRQNKTECPGPLRDKVAFFENMESAPKISNTIPRLPFQADGEDSPSTTSTWVKEPNQSVPVMNSQQIQTLAVEVCSKYTNTTVRSSVLVDENLQVDENLFSDEDTQNQCVNNVSKKDDLKNDLAKVRDLAEDLKCQVSKTNQFVEVIQRSCEETLQEAREGRQELQSTLNSLSNRINPQESLILDKLCAMEKSIESSRQPASYFDVIKDTLSQMRSENADCVANLTRYANDVLSEQKQNIEASIQKLSVDVQQQISSIQRDLEQLKELKPDSSSRSPEDNSLSEKEDSHVLKMRMVELKSQRDAEKMYHKITRESLRALERDHDRLRHEMLLAPSKRRQDDRRKSSHLQVLINETLQSKMADLGSIPFASSPIKNKDTPSKESSKSIPTVDVANAGKNLQTKEEKQMTSSSHSGEKDEDKDE